jgi:hypothetical protein
MWRGPGTPHVRARWSGARRRHDLPSGGAVARGARRQEARRARGPARSEGSPRSGAGNRDHERGGLGQAPLDALRRRPCTAYAHADDRRLARLRGGAALATRRSRRPRCRARRRRYDRRLLLGSDRRAAAAGRHARSLDARVAHARTARARPLRARHGSRYGARPSRPARSRHRACGSAPRSAHRRRHRQRVSSRRSAGPSACRRSWRWARSTPRPGAGCSRPRNASSGAISRRHIAPRTRADSRSIARPAGVARVAAPRSRRGPTATAVPRIGAPAASPSPRSPRRRRTQEFSEKDNREPLVVHLTRPDPTNGRNP